MRGNAPVATDAIFDNAIGRTAMALDPFTEADPVGVHVSLLCAFSAYLGHDVKVQSASGPMPLSIWATLVGVTGVGRKGTATNHALKVVNAGLKSWAPSGVHRGLPATGLGFAELMSERASDDGFDPPVIVEEEMDNQIANAKKDHRLGVFLRKAWDGQTFRHKTSKVDWQIKKPHLGIIGHVQPKNWGAIAGSKDATGGTYNRFLPVWVARSKTLSVFTKTDGCDEVILAEAKRFRIAAAAGREMGTVTVSEETAELFEAYHRPLAESLTAENEELAQMSERALAYLIRIAALYAVADGRDEIGIEDFDSALALVTYSVETVQYVLPEVGGETLASKIKVALIAAGDEGLQTNELWDFVGRRYTKAQLTEAINSLPQVVTRKGKSTGGRPPQIYTWREGAREKVSA